MGLMHPLVLTSLIAIIMLSGCIGAQSENTLYEQSGTANNSLMIVDAPVKYASVNGIEIGYREFGSGEPILIILPFGATMDKCNDTFIGMLAVNNTVILFDNRGMGYSSDNNETYSMSLFANDTAGFIDALGLSSLNLYGVSMGASIAQEVTLAYPEKVDTLILSSATYSLNISETAILTNGLEAVADNPDADPVLRKYAEANLEWNGTYERLPDISINILLLTGTADVLTPSEVSDTMETRLPHAQSIMFEGIVHSGEMYAPEDYANAVIDFLNSE